MSELSTVRTTDVIAAEINSIKEQTRKTVILNCIEIGRRLAEAKVMLPHGQWGKWLEENVQYSQSTANNMLKIFEQYSADQLSIFGDNIKSQTFEKLSYSQAVALLGVPEAEREAFAQENKVEEMSTRELKAAIEAKRKLEEELAISKKEAELERKAKEKLAKSYEELERHNKAHEELAESLQKELDKQGMPDYQHDNQEEIERLQIELQKSKSELHKAKTDYKKLESDLKKKPIEAAVVEKVPEDMEKELEELRKQVSQNNSESITKFKMNFEETVSDFKKLLSSLHDIKESDREQYEKYKIAVSGLIKKCQDALE